LQRYYDYFTSVSFTITIAKGDAIVTSAPTEAIGLTYNGSAQPLLATSGSASGGELQYSLVSGGPYETFVPSATNANDYTVYYKVIGDANHNDGRETSLSVTIGRKDVNVDIVAANKHYDGTTLANLTDTTFTGMVAGDDLSLTGGSLSFDNKNVGTGKTVTLSGFSLAGADATNYTLTANSAIDYADISRANVTVDITGFAQDKTYDDTNIATLADTTFNGLYAGDELYLVGGAATFASANAANNIPVTLSGFSLGGADTANYSLASPTATDAADIKPLPVTIIPATGQQKFFGTTDPASFAYTYSPALIGGDVLTGDLQRVDGEAVGTYTYTLGTLAISPTTANYALSLATTASFTITAIAPTLDGTVTSLPSASLADGAYNADVVDILDVRGAPAPTISITGLPSGLSSSADGVITGVPTNPGSYQVSVTASNAGGTVSTTLTFVVGVADYHAVASTFDVDFGYGYRDYYEAPQKVITLLNDGVNLLTLANFITSGDLRWAVGKAFTINGLPTVAL
jgi:hypothetical protein